MNLIPILALVAGGFFLMNKLQNVSVLAQSFDYKKTVKNFRFHTWREIRFSLEISIINPSNITLKVTKPLIQVFYNGTLLTRSNYDIKDLSIKAMTESVLPRFDFSIDIVSNWFTIYSMLTKLIKGVSFTNTTGAQSIIEKNQTAFLKLLNVKFTGNTNGIPFIKSFNLG